MHFHAKWSYGLFLTLNSVGCPSNSPKDDSEMRHYAFTRKQYQDEAGHEAGTGMPVQA